MTFQTSPSQSLARRSVGRADRHTRTAGSLIRFVVIASVTAFGLVVRSGSAQTPVQPPEALPASTPSTAPTVSSSPASSEPVPPTGPATPDTEQAAPISPTSEYELTLSDGRTLRGKLLRRDAEQVVILLGAVETTFTTRAVASIREIAPIEERYKELKAAIEVTDSPGLMRLADWLYKNERYDWAVIEIENSLKADPGNFDARELRLLIVEQRKVAEASRKAKEKREAERKLSESHPAPPPEGTESDPAGAGGEKSGENSGVKTADKRLAFPLISEADINIIRVFEVDLNNPPKLNIPPDVIAAFMTKFAGARVEGAGTIPTSEQGRRIYARRKPVEILSDMFVLRARDFYPRVSVMENPRSLQLFRDNVNKGWLVNSCATTKCHGGEEAGRLRLYDKKQASDVAAYTNFIILERFRIAGEDGKRTVPMINYTEPASSPLLQMGLPRGDSAFTHPDLGKTKIRPAFQSPKDERFEQTVSWIKSMYPKRPDYPISYIPPGSDRPEPPPAAPR